MPRSSDRRSTPPSARTGARLRLPSTAGAARRSIRPPAPPGRSARSLLLECFAPTASRSGRSSRAATGATACFLSNDRAGIYAIGYAVPRPIDHAVTMAEICDARRPDLRGVAGGGLGVLGRLSGRHPVTGRELLREIRRSFYRKLFLLFVARVCRSRAGAGIRHPGLRRRRSCAKVSKTSAVRTASAARRVIETVVSQQRRDRKRPGDPHRRDHGLGEPHHRPGRQRLREQQPGCHQPAGPVRLGVAADRARPRKSRGPSRSSGRPATSATSGSGLLQYTVAAVPVRDGEAGAILTVPLTLRQQEIEDEIDALDRRVILAAMLFIPLGAAIGYFTAERIADPVNRLTRASRRIARGDLDARIHIATADELRPPGRGVQPDGGRPEASARRARADQPSGRVGRHGATGRARHQEPADADSAVGRAPQTRPRRKRRAARRGARQLRRTPSSRRSACFVRSPASFRASRRRRSRVLAPTRAARGHRRGASRHIERVCPTTSRLRGAPRPRTCPCCTWIADCWAARS